jgi:hypothetical protein
MTKVVGDNLIMHVRKKLRQKFGYPQGEQMSKSRIKGKERKQVKKWNIPTIHTLPTGVKRGTSSGVKGQEGELGFRKCDLAFGNACFSTGAVGFLMASVVVNSLARGPVGKQESIPRAVGTVGRRRGPIPNTRSNSHLNTNTITKPNPVSDALSSHELSINPKVGTKSNPNHIPAATNPEKFSQVNLDNGDNGNSGPNPNPNPIGHTYSESNVVTDSNKNSNADSKTSSQTNSNIDSSFGGGSNEEGCNCGKSNQNSGEGEGEGEGEASERERDLVLSEPLDACVGNGLLTG